MKELGTHETKSIYSVEQRDRAFLEKNFSSLKEFSYGLPDLFMRVIFHSGPLAGTEKTIAFISHDGLKTSEELARIIPKWGLSTIISGNAGMA